MRQLRSFLLTLAIMIIGCGPSGGNIISATEPPKNQKTDAQVMVLTANPNPPPAGGTGFIESYTYPTDGAVLPPRTIVCEAGTIYTCEAFCVNGKRSRTVCNELGNDFVQQPTAIASGVCYCPEDPWVLPDAGLPATPPMPDASTPDTVVTAHPDASPDTTTRTDAYVADVYVSDVYVPPVVILDAMPDTIKTDAYVPNTYIPPVTLPPLSPDASPMPDLQTPDATVPDTYIAPDIFTPDVDVPDVFIPTDVWTAPDMTSDTTPDVIVPDMTPPPECTTESPTDVSGITLTQSGQQQFTVVWTVDGCSSMGYKVIWSKNPGPTYPTRSGDHYAFLSDPDEKQLTIDTSSPGTYYVRVCQYLGGRCGLYSNELVITLQ